MDKDELFKVCVELNSQMMVLTCNMNANLLDHDEAKFWLSSIKKEIVYVKAHDLTKEKTGQHAKCVDEIVDGFARLKQTYVEDYFDSSFPDDEKEL